MCNLDQYTLADLQSMTKNAIIATWAQGRTYDEITNREFDTAGQLIVLKIKTHSVLPDDVISQTKTKWLFHENGTIHKITHFDYGADGTLINRYTIFHDAEGHTPPYRVNEGTMPENGNGGAAMKSQEIITIIGAPMSFSVETSRAYFDEPDIQWTTPDVTEVPTILGIPVMSKTLWKLFKR